MSDQIDLIAPTPARYFGRTHCDRCELGDQACYVVNEVTAARWCRSCCVAAGVPMAAPRTAADLELDDGRPRRVR